MELATLLEMEAGEMAVAAVPEAPPGDAPPGDGEITGYELDDADWEALKAARDGRGDSLPGDSVSWLETCGLLEGTPPVPTAFAIEWLARSE